MVLSIYRRTLSKIQCGQAHFAALENDVEFPVEPVNDWQELRRKL